MIQIIYICDECHNVQEFETTLDTDHRENLSDMGWSADAHEGRAPDECLACDTCAS